jgi:hypothetical protein
MGREFVIEVGGLQAVAELTDDAAPRLCEEFWSDLPVESFATHAKFAGEELIVMIPGLYESENEILEVIAGDIGYYPGRQTVCLFYGEITPFGKVSRFARVTENLAALAKGGETIRRVGSLPFRMSRRG